MQKNKARGRTNRSKICLRALPARPNFTKTISLSYQLHLAFEGVDLLRYVIELFSSKRSCFRHFLNSAIRFAHCGSDTYCNSRQPAFLSHWSSSMENGAILYLNTSRSH